MQKTPNIENTEMNVSMNEQFMILKYLILVALNIKQL